jgi:hypothetical protein
MNPGWKYDWIKISNFQPLLYWHKQLFSNENAKYLPTIYCQIDWGWEYNWEKISTFSTASMPTEKWYYQ